MCRSSISYSRDTYSSNETHPTEMKIKAAGSSKVLMYGCHDHQQSISPHSVIIGRRNSCRQHIGNQRLESLAKSMLSEYAQANGRNAKGRVVSALIDHVHSKGGDFVRYNEEDGTYRKVNIRAMREKVGVVLRNLVGPIKYKSSCQSKVVARRERKAQSTKKKQIEPQHLHDSEEQQSLLSMPSPDGVLSAIKIPTQPQPKPLLSLSSPADVLSLIVIPPRPDSIPQGSHTRESHGANIDGADYELLSSEEILDIPFEDCDDEDDESSSAARLGEESLESC